MFAATCKGKDGRLWSIHIPVDTWEDAWNIICELGLDVDKEDLGLLVAHGPINELAGFMQQVLEHTVEMLGPPGESAPEPAAEDEFSVVVAAFDEEHKEKVH